MEVTAPDALHDDLQSIDDIERQMRALSASLLERISDIDAGWIDDPSIPDLACEMAARQNITSNLARERLRVARALRELPHLRHAHAQGRISWDQLRWLTRFVTPETDEAWTERGSGMRPNALRLEAQRQQRTKRTEAESDHTMRSLWMAWDQDGRFLDIHATLAAEQGAYFESALNAAAQHITVEEDVEDRKGARLVDAFVGLVTASGGRSQTPSLVIHADAEVLAGTNDGDRHLAETSGGIQLSHEAVRRVACDAKLLAALHRGGQPVGIVSKGRTVTEHQMEMLVFRDRGCTFPGCGSTWFLHAHHMRHWADDGKTTLENLTLLCGSHHRRVHEGGWVIRGRPPDELEFASRSRRISVRSGPAERRAS